MRLFNRKKVIDEREQMEMYRNEHYVFWFWFWALAGGIIVKRMIFWRPFMESIWEFAIFLIGAIWLAVLDFRDGHYDYISKPGWKSYLGYSVVFAVLLTVALTIGGWYQGWIVSLKRAVPVALIEFAFIFAVLYAVTAGAGAITKRRRKKLEKKFLEEEE